MSADMAALIAFLPWALGGWFVLAVVDRAVYYWRGRDADHCGHCEYVEDIATAMQELQAGTRDVCGGLDEVAKVLAEIRDAPEEESASGRSFRVSG